MVSEEQEKTHSKRQEMAEEVAKIQGIHEDTKIQGIQEEIRTNTKIQGIHEGIHEGISSEEEGDEIMEAIKIKNRFTDEVIYESDTATTIKEAVEEAIKNKINISEADLRYANLREANLTGADLTGTDLSYANLSKANLCYCKMDKKVFKQITEEWFEWDVSD